MSELALVQAVAESTSAPKKEPEPSLHVRIGNSPYRHRALIDRSQTCCGLPIIGYYAPLDRAYIDLCPDGCFSVLELQICAEEAAKREAKEAEAQREHERESQRRIEALREDHEAARQRLETDRMMRIERGDVTDTATDPTRPRRKEDNDD